MCRQPVVVLVIAKAGESSKVYPRCFGASVKIPQVSGDENVSEKCLYLEFRTRRGAPYPLLDSNLEMGRIDS